MNFQPTLWLSSAVEVNDRMHSNRESMAKGKILYRVKFHMNTEVFKGCHDLKMSLGPATMFKFFPDKCCTFL